MKKRPVWIGFALALGLFAAAGWSLSHPGFAVLQLQDYVARKTGRALFVNGEATLEFFPRLGVRLDDVFLSNPSGMGGNFAHAVSARLPLDFSGLFRRRLKVREIYLFRPGFNLLIDRQGRNNWATGVEGGEETAENPGTTARSKEPLTLVVEGASANFLDERSGQAFSLQEAAARIAIGDDAELDIQGTAALNGQQARIDAQVKSLRRVGRDGSPFDLTVTAPALAVNFTGRLATAEKLNLAGAIDATSPNLRELVAWLGSGIAGEAGLKNLSVAGALDSEGVVFKLAKASIALDGMVASGGLSLDLSSKTPRIDAMLTTDLLTLDPYFMARGPVAAGQQNGADGWNTDGLSYAGLNGVAGSLSLSASLIRWGGAELGPAKISSTLGKGRLEADIQDASLKGGKASARIVLDGATETPALQFSVDARGVSGEKFFPEFANLNWLAGNTSFSLSLAANGHSQQEMLSTVEGNFNISVSDGEITGLNIVELISKVSAAVSSGWGEGPENLSSFDSARASFTVKDGVARTGDVKVESAAFQVSGSGDIDLLRQALEFKFDPALASGGGQVARLPVQVVVSGPWRKPRIYPDMEGILDNPDAAYDALRELGLSGKAIRKIGRKGDKLLKKLFGN